MRGFAVGAADGGEAVGGGIASSCSVDWGVGAVSGVVSFFASLHIHPIPVQWTLYWKYSGSRWDIVKLPRLSDWW